MKNEAKNNSPLSTANSHLPEGWEIIALKDTCKVFADGNWIESKDQILEIGEQGATRQAITKVQLENFKIVMPKTIEEQKQIVKKIDALSAETKKLESIYQKKVVDLEELKKSILQKAFNGEL